MTQAMEYNNLALRLQGIDFFKVEDENNDKNQQAQEQASIPTPNNWHAVSGSGTLGTRVLLRNRGGRRVQTDAPAVVFVET